MKRKFKKMAPLIKNEGDKMDTKWVKDFLCLAATRSCNPPFLTPAGHAFCPLALDIVEQVHQARHTLRRGNGMAGAPTWRATHLPVVLHNPGLA